MKIKQIILSTFLCLSFTGCAVTDIAYDSYLLRTNFDSNFKYNVEVLNTREDNQKLLSNIENDKKLMESLNRNKNENQIDHSYYLKYKLLKDRVEKTNSDNSKTTKASIKKKENVKPKPVVAKKENVKPKPVVAKKENVKPKPVVAKKESIIEKDFKTEFFNIEKRIKPFYYIIISHCNVEDSYLLIEDIEQFKNKIKEFEENKYAQNYIFDQYKKEIDSCLVYYYENKMLNPE